MKSPAQDAAMTTSPARAARSLSAWLAAIALAAAAPWLLRDVPQPGGLLLMSTIIVLLGVAFALSVDSRSRALQRMRARYLALAENSPDGIVVLDGDARIESVNAALLALSGYDAAELIGQPVDCLVPTAHAGHGQHVANYMKSPRMRYMGSGRELALRHRDGHNVAVEISLAPVITLDEFHVVAAVRDISARKAAERALQASERRLRGVTNALPGAVYQFERRADGQQGLTFLSDGIRALLDIDGAPTPTTLDALLTRVVADDLPALMHSIEQAARDRGPWMHEFRVRTERGAVRWVRGNSLPSPPDEFGTCEWNGILIDVSETRQLSEQLAFQALNDGLTGLPNRRGFEARLLEQLEASRASGALTVAFLDLDQFKVINDTCGHSAGDELLRQVATALKDRLRSQDVLARLGGDEFAIIMASGLDLAEAVLQRVREALADMRFVWEGKAFNLSFSAGLVAAHGATPPAELLRCDDAACYAAKDAGRNCVRVFHDQDTQVAIQHGQMRWVPLITDALQNHRFQLYAQPIMAIGAGRQPAVHYEVLLRMLLPDGELAPPGAFLPAAERYNLAPRLDRWVVTRLFEFIEGLLAKGIACPTFNVNLSGLSMCDNDTTHFIAEQLRRRSVPPTAICFEITETAAIAQLSQAREFIAQLKHLGCRFALDDFGSGISSFGQLKNLDIDYVKIDGMFVRDIARDPVDLVMVTAINDMAHALGIETVAEFIEDEAVLSLVRGIGVDFAQGYAIGRPQPLDERLVVDSAAGLAVSPPSRQARVC
ncbi:MAG: EAL domain-containing protein [Proteobacteria bacterium]|nr:EAL domain-containing protein [Pseudomonadota bacterium]